MSHIEIDGDQECCGCAACVAVCPQSCIAMKANSEGFLYPAVDKTHCSDCGLCLQTCPWMNQPRITNAFSPPRVYAAWHLDDETRRLSSSGGVFTALADAILEKGGCVAGAAWDADMVCRHILVEDSKNLDRLRGSKYVQSEIAPELFARIGNELSQKRHLLFTGTPCQVAALRNFLGQDDENLLCCDLVCHGVPSPAWLRKHLAASRKRSLPVTSIRFRDKTNGWKRFGVRKIYSDGSSLYKGMHADPYMASFLKNMCLRPSCYKCKYTSTARPGDITLADYWRVATKYPEYDREDKGTSLLLINSNKGRKWLDHCRATLFLGEGDLFHAMSGNPMLSRPATRPPERDTFMEDISILSVSELRKKYGLHPRPLLQRGLGYIQRRLRLRGPNK
jgi:NAD-dependent dihydropyrimidine dehydrogenase PreA subunit